MRSTAEAIWRWIDSTGRSAAICTSTSSRRITSAALLAWIVVIEPSWPVFIACSMSSDSPDRHSPTTIRSGRMRRAILHQVANRVLAAPFDVGPFRFEPHDVLLGQLQFGRVFDRDDSFLVGNEIAQAIEQRRFAAAGAAGDDDVGPCRARRP